MKTKISCQVLEKKKNSCQLSQLIGKLVFTYVCVVIANFNASYSFLPNQISYERVYDWNNGQ